jgi:hypothetical protein
MSAPPPPPDPWTSPPADVAWFDAPVKRSNYLTLLRKHNAALYVEACDFYRVWRLELDSDASAAESAA